MSHVASAGLTPVEVPEQWPAAKAGALTGDDFVKLDYGDAAALYREQRGVYNALNSGMANPLEGVK